MDSFARGLLIADALLSDPRIDELSIGRYRSFESGKGKRFEQGELSLSEMRDIAATNGEPQRLSARQELVENLINDAIAAM